ncbi:carbon storage regulator [Georgenia sp. AZ-5]|uniref:carbon storage regulator n=1 Tax=Georgenia sp. AZ-5 TaxID=3367526 RepID=UPI0037540A1F
MLVVTRKPGERILIGEDVVVTVLEQRRDAVRIGIQAPAEVRIQRAEVVEAVERTNAAAAQGAAAAEDQLKELFAPLSRARARPPRSR